MGDDGPHWAHWRSQDFIVGGAKLRPIQPVGGRCCPLSADSTSGGGGGCCPLSADSTSVRGPLLTALTRVGGADEGQGGPTADVTVQA